MVKIQKSFKSAKKDVSKKSKKTKKLDKKNMAIDIERKEFVEEILNE